MALFFFHHTRSCFAFRRGFVDPDIRACCHRFFVEPSERLFYVTPRLSFTTRYRHAQLFSPSYAMPLLTDAHVTSYHTSSDYARDATMAMFILMPAADAATSIFYYSSPLCH